MGQAVGQSLDDASAAGMICGLRRFAGSDISGLDAMLTALPGRELDTCATWVEGSVGLGWRGRALGAGKEETDRLPRFDAGTGLAITASARLDGRAELCEALGMPRAGRAELSDSALILMSYARWGAACPEHLLGDYAFALWDARRQVLFCARDHIGARPFFYAHSPERFIFASGIGSVLAAPGVSEQFDTDAVATRLTYGARQLGARTCYRAVRRLLPGHSLLVEGGKARVERWWRPEETPPARNLCEDDFAGAVLAACTDAVRDRLRCADPVGVHLSGGLDSSSVAVLATRELRRQGRPSPVAFSWQPPPGPGLRDKAEAAEHGLIEAVRRQEGLQLLYRPPQASDVVAFLRRDGTRGDDEGTLIQEAAVQCAAAEYGVEVLLSGWGGDEGVSHNGRGYFPQLLRSGQMRRLWRELGERSAHPSAMLLTEAALPLVSRRAARVAMQLRRRQWPFRRNATFIHPAFARRARLLPPASRQPAGGVRDIQLHLLQHGHLSQRMEGWAAHGACHGIEYRYPLLDRRVLELVLSLPPEQFRRGRRSRWVMRRAFESLLPAEVCWAAKEADPLRFGALEDAIGKALPTVRGMIQARGEPPSRSCYLDLPRLLEQADPVRWRASGRHSPMLNALRFLDF